VFNLPHSQQTYILHSVFSGLPLYIFTPLKLTSSKFGHIGQFTSIFGASHTLTLTFNCNISFIFIHKLASLSFHPLALTVFVLGFRARHIY
jgi:hypothetical protein